MIAFEGVTKTYATRSGRKEVLRGATFTVAPGEKLGVLGLNGAGKSTLLRLAGGVERPSAGVIRRGMTVSWPIAFTGAFQNSLTGLDNVKFLCRVYGVELAPRAEFVEDFSELGRAMREPVRTYSAGMRARLAFAVSMAVDFDCYLIDVVLAVGVVRFQQKCRTELFE
jgi:capsular polysaccharide transport system ATP-binding protein